MGLFSSPIPPGITFRHPYRFRTRQHDGAVRFVCDCGQASDWMLTAAGAQHAADRHAATGSNTWDR